MRRNVTAALVIVILLMPVLAPRLRAGQADEASPSTSEPLNADLETADAESFAASQGISLEEAKQRLGARGGLDPAISFIVSQRDNFGGVFVDQPAGGTLDVALAAESVKMRAAVSRLLPETASIRWRVVQRSLTDLDKIRNELIGRIPDFQGAGASVASIGIDVRRNVVVLTVDGPIDKIGHDLRQDFGGAVEVASGPMLSPVVCSSRSSCDPWRGGIKILPGDGSGFQCSYGFNVRSATSSTKYMMTAGHCDNENWRHAGYSIGTTNLNNLQTSGSVLGDFQRAPTFLASPMNLIYASDTDKSRAITAIRTYRNQLIGDYVCASGVMNGYRCGSIVDDDLHYGIVFRGQTIYMWGKLAGSTGDPLRSDPGDSGGPVFNGGTAYGIVSARDGNTKTAYSVSDHAMSALGIRFCLSSLCP